MESQFRSGPPRELRLYISRLPWKIQFSDSPVTKGFIEHDRQIWFDEISKELSYLAEDAEDDVESQPARLLFDGPATLWIIVVADYPRHATNYEVRHIRDALEYCRVFVERWDRLVVVTASRRAGEDVDEHTLIVVREGFPPGFPGVFEMNQVEIWHQAEQRQEE